MTIKLFLKLITRRFICLESFCKECGRTVYDFQVPDDIWLQIEPLIEHGHVLCYDCF
jgi:hypothetical protein